MPGLWKWIGALGLLAAAPQFPAKKDLTDTAIQVADCDDWHLPSYEWYSGDRIFYLRRTATEFQGCLVQLGQPFELLAKAFNRRIGDRYVHYRLSPDRKWALIPQWENEKAVSFRALSLDGVTEKSFPVEAGEPLDFAWLPDGTGFMTVDGDREGFYLTRYAMTATRQIARVPIRLHAAPTSPDRECIQRLEPTISFLGFTSSGKAAICMTSPRRGVAAEVFEVSSDGKVPSKSLLLDPGPDGSVAEVASSPKGDHLASLVQTVGPMQERRTEIRISRRDGTETRTLGGVEKQVDAENPSSLRWTASGTHVSFGHRGKLYAVEAVPPKR